MKIANITSDGCAITIVSLRLVRFPPADLSGSEIESPRSPQIQRKQDPGHRKLRKRKAICEGQRSEDGRLIVFGEHPTEMEVPDSRR